MGAYIWASNLVGVRDFFFMCISRGRGALLQQRLVPTSYTYDPPIYDITSRCKVAALFWREVPRWTPDAIWFLRYFNLQANGIMYLECREC